MHLIMKYAYIDEYGAYGFKFSDLGCTAHYMDTLLDIVKGYRDNQKYYCPLNLDVIAPVCA